MQNVVSKEIVRQRFLKESRLKDLVASKGLVEEVSPEGAIRKG